MCGAGTGAVSESQAQPDVRRQAARTHVSPEERVGAAPGQGLDDLQRLWTPWRLAYVRDPDAAGTGCPFCELPNRGRDHDGESLIVYRAPSVFVILNAYPYNPGHLLIVPFRHTDDFGALTPEELHEMADMSQRAVKVLRDTSGAHAFNIGLNVGGIAGAGIADHVHQHVVPRWGGDTNFMPVIGQTRVLPELLAETYARIAPAFAQSPGL
jgi:ATP adenylyltransferase